MIGDVRRLRIRRTTRVRPGYRPQRQVALVLDCTGSLTCPGKPPCWHLLVAVPTERPHERLA